MISLFFVLASFLFHLLPAHACSPDRIAARASPDAFTFGSDPPAPPATVGYTINHFALVANDLSAMQDFYVNVLGMRHIFTYRASSTFTVVYLGYSHGGKNGTGYQTGEELYSEKNNIEGLIELVHHSDNRGPDFVPSTKKANTFSHIGLIVPNILEAQKRMEEYGVNIVKRSGEPVEWGSAGAKVFGFDEIHSTLRSARVALAGIDKIGFENFLMITDPDGNLLEVQPQD